MDKNSKKIPVANVLSSKLRAELTKKSSIADKNPDPSEINKNIKSYTYERLDISWHHDRKKQILYVKSALGAYFFKVPSGWDLQEWSSPLRRLAEVLIFQQFWLPADLKIFLEQDWTPWLTHPKSDSKDAASVETAEVAEAAEAAEVSDVSEVYKKEKKDSQLWEQRRTKNVSAISFSGGLDSCAIVPLLESGFFMGYLKREIQLPTMLKHTQQLLALDHILKNYECSAFIMESDIELISLKCTGRVGFPSEYACTLPCVILADYLGISAICTGTIGLFLKGTRYQEFNKTSYYTFWRSLFLKAGIELFWPVGGVVDRGTAIICQKTGIPGQSCLRNDKGFCNRCFKCFRKNTLLLHKTGTSGLGSGAGPSGHGGSSKIRIPLDAQAKLSKKPLTLIELYKLGIIKDKNLAPFASLDLSYQSHYLKDSYDFLVPTRMKKHICLKLDKLLGPMTKDQIKVVKTMNLSQLDGLKIDLSS